MKTINMLIVLTFVCSCGIKRDHCENFKMGDMACNFFHGDDTEAEIKSLNDKVDDLEDGSGSMSDRITSLENAADALDVRMSLLESVNYILFGIVNTNSSALNDVVIPKLFDIEQRLYDLEIVPGVDLVPVQDQLAHLNTEINTLKETSYKNDEYVDMPGCEHSYFVLYNANGSIREVYVTENNGTVGGSWILNNNTNYNLVIDGNITCTGLKYNKSLKELYFNNGTANVIDLSY